MKEVIDPVGQKVFFPVASRVFDPPANVPTNCTLRMGEGSYEVVDSQGVVLSTGRIIETRKPDDL